MSIRTTVTLDEDVLMRIQDVSRTRGASFRDTINDLLRIGLLNATAPQHKRTLRIEPVSMGQKPGLNYDDVEGLISYAEGEQHR